MLSIPLPFVISLLLIILAITLYQRQQHSSHSLQPSALKPAIGFIGLCAVMITLVGIRWSWDIAFIRFLQPIVAATVPTAAWYCFSQGQGQKRLPWPHWLSPIVITGLSYSYPIWQPPIDALLVLLYVGYGTVMIRTAMRTSQTTETPPARIRLSQIDQVFRAELIAGCALLFSACVDLLLTLDFAFYQGQHAAMLVSTAQSLLIPLLVWAVVTVGQSIADDSPERMEVDSPERMEVDSLEQMQIDNLEQVEVSSPERVEIENPQDQGQEQQTPQNPSHIDNEVQQVAAIITQLITEQQLFLDPDLTLNRLARKAGIPSRQISEAINQIEQQSISQLLNHYRIEHAKHLLLTTDDPITQVYLSSGYQTKSNFNRAFSNITGTTPSQFRRQAAHSD